MLLNKCAHSFYHSIRNSGEGRENQLLLLNIITGVDLKLSLPTYSGILKMKLCMLLNGVQQPFYLYIYVPVSVLSPEVKENSK